MTSEDFTLTFDGEAIHDGEIDIYALTPALMSAADVFRDASRALYSGEATVRVSVKAEFKAGSFATVLRVEQELRDATAVLLPAMHALGADHLVATVIGKAWEIAKEKAEEKAPDVIQGLFKLLEKLKGETPKDIKREPSNNVSIFVLGNNNHINVEQRTADLDEDRSTLASATKLASTLKRQGLSDLKFKVGSQEVAKLGEADVPNAEQTLDLLDVVETARLIAPSSDQEIVLKLIGPNFADGKWYVSDGGQPFPVTMEDDNFKARVHSREIGFYDGDLYRVLLNTSQEVRGGRLSTRKSIKKVVAAEQLPKVFSLFKDDAEPV